MFPVKHGNETAVHRDTSNPTRLKRQHAYGRRGLQCWKRGADSGRLATGRLRLEPGLPTRVPPSAGSGAVCEARQSRREWNLAVVTEADPPVVLNLLNSGGTARARRGVAAEKAWRTPRGAH